MVRTGRAAARQEAGHDGEGQRQPAAEADQLAEGTVVRLPVLRRHPLLEHLQGVRLAERLHLAECHPSLGLETHQVVAAGDDHGAGAVPGEQRHHLPGVERVVQDDEH
ncbi:hypothetical protein RND15_48665, partial [Streptomyces sp. DSM 41529]